MQKLQPYIPYLGNKFRIAEDIYAVMRTNFTFKNVVSLFCGGGALELLLAQKGFAVLANDLDSGLIELHNHLLHHGNIPKDFITREMFFEMKDQPNWLGAYIRHCWSFGNNQEDYMYSVEREKGDPALLIEHGSRIKHLEDYRSLDVSSNIRFISNDYRDVDLSPYSPADTIIYCDPPYKGTRGYHVGEFDNEAFYKWALALPYTALISEYDMPEPFTCIASFPKRQGIGNYNATVLEKLYTNKPVQIGLGL